MLAEGGATGVTVTEASVRCSQVWGTVTEKVIPEPVY